MAQLLKPRTWFTPPASMGSALPPPLAQGSAPTPPKGPPAEAGTATGNAPDLKFPALDWLANLHQRSVMRFELDLARWNQAVTFAEYPQYPRRYYLYGVYDQALWNLHLASVINTRINFVLNHPYRILGPDGREAPELTAMFNQGWFRKFRRLVLESIYWGHSLIQLLPETDPLTGRVRICVELVPRRHVRPETGEIMPYPMDSRGFRYKESYPRTDAFPGALGTDPYDQQPYSYRNFANIIEAGEPNDLGLLKTASRAAIAANNAEQDWDELSTKFGLPYIWMKTNSIAKDDLDTRQDLLENFIGGNHGLGLNTDEIELLAAPTINSVMMFTERIKLAEAQMSKLILGQTMLVDDGSSRAQADIHYEVAKGYFSGDAALLRDVVNDRLLPILNLPAGCTFELRQHESMNMADRIILYKGVKELGFTFSTQQVEDTFGIEVQPAQLTPDLVEAGIATTDELRAQLGLPAVVKEEAHTDKDPAKAALLATPAAQEAIRSLLNDIANGYISSEQAVTFLVNNYGYDQDIATKLATPPPPKPAVVAAPKTETAPA